MHIWQLVANSKPTDPDAACYRARCNDIFRSARFGYLLCVKNLLDVGADPNIRDKWDRTPLHYAAQEGHVGTVALLLDYGADPNAKNVAGDTPLHTGLTGFGNEATALILDERIADVNVKNNEGRTPLHLAAERGYARVIELLLSRGADITARDAEGNTPLHYVELLDMARGDL